MDTHLTRTAALVFGSGLCALIYQTTWLREFRLIFGASTPASAAVLAIFMGGLGLGSAVLGRRVDWKGRPLLFYGQLELIIAVSAALTPVLIWLVRQVYMAMGGTPALGLGWGSVARLALSALVLAVPTFVMGGTLPAIARAVETAGDSARRHLAIVYGVNTLGAVAGTLLSTFYLFEHLGNRMSLWLACALNLVVAITAIGLGRRQKIAMGQGEATPAAQSDGRAEYPARFVFLAAAVVGFVFFLMELVWYRMLTPLLGGSTFTFGLILAIALLGIGAGSLVYHKWAAHRAATLAAFAGTCALEALCLAYPFALGDRLAILTILLRPLGLLEFFGHVAGWTIVCAIVVLPAALVAGFQFPLLIALLGKGERQVGRHTGYAYGWNTAGAIAGSLAGGFGILPLLTAPGTWRLVIALLVALGVAALWLSWSRDRILSLRAGSMAASGLALLMLLSPGPTAVWRHSPIGAGRVDPDEINTRNKSRRWMQKTRREIVWQADGRDTCVGLKKDEGYAFIVNGKNDGNIRTDAGTQVMSGLLAAMLHGSPKAVLVVGLGTGSTAGWLGAIPSVERVDVVELERAIKHVAHLCAAGNMAVLQNPKVHFIEGDGREVLLTTRRSYDLIVSEPSNLYRAGVAGLYTRDFYQVAARKLKQGGIFVQWLQGYETDFDTTRIAYATLSSVFSSIETWLTMERDFLFVASMQGIDHDLERLRGTIREEPYKSALANAWRATDLEGVFARFLVNDGYARTAAELQGGILNTDDRNVLEYAYARSVGRSMDADPELLRERAADLGQHRPERLKGGIDWKTVDQRRRSMMVAYESSVNVPKVNPERSQAYNHYVDGQLADALSAWKKLKNPEPRDLVETMLLAECLANAGQDEAQSRIEQLRVHLPIEADALLARWHLRQGREAEAIPRFEAAFTAFRINPWPERMLMARTLKAVENAADDASAAFDRRLFNTLAEPFAAACNDSDRLWTRLALAKALDQEDWVEGDRNQENWDATTLQAIQAFEPHIPWTKGFLRVRARCYARLNHPKAPAAERDLQTFLAQEPPGP